MRALRILELSGPDGLALVDDAPEPELGDGVIIDVEAAGVSFPDLLLARGEYQLRPEPPFTGGIEAAGVVREAAAGSGFAPGDRVVAFGPGAWAERVAAPAAFTFPLPPELSMAEGAGLIMNHHTAHFALLRRAGLRAGETVLVHGAAGGVGTAAIQVANAAGARSVAVVSSDEKAGVAREAGAAEVVRVDEEWPLADVIFDPVGGERTGASLRRLNPEGRLVVIGFAEGSIPSIALNRVLFRNVSIVGAAWGEWIGRNAAEARPMADDLARMAAAGHVRPIVGRVWPLAEGADALRALDGRTGVGKLVLEVPRS